MGGYEGYEFGMRVNDHSMGAAPLSASGKK